MRATISLIPLALLLIAGAPPSPQKTPAPDDTSPQPLSLAVAGHARDTLLRVLVRPYAEATGTALGTPAWDGSGNALKALIAQHGADLVVVSGGLLADLCHGGQLQHLDWGTLGRDRFVAGQTSDCGAGAYLSETVLAWDQDKLGVTPSWADFWDVAKHPGRRGLRRGARGNLEIALLADGVSAGDVYRTLRSSDGVDRAFRKLDQLKPYVLWWDQAGQPGQLLATAKVLMTSAPSNALPVSGKLHVGMQWQSGLQELASWAVPAQPAHPQAEAAALLVATDPARLASFAGATGLGPPTKLAVALLPDALRARNPGLAAHLQAGLMLDEGFWAEGGEKLEARFAAWVGK